MVILFYFNSETEKPNPVAMLAEMHVAIQPHWEMSEEIKDAKLSFCDEFANLNGKNFGEFRVFNYTASKTKGTTTNSSPLLSQERGDKDFVVAALSRV